ncbi:ABA4-like family protein [Halobaculum sp. MBLA0147]|uniref:ABA4-like family protein n=1 Tax=Halobaculum sp. MBLA0147 TaxID=3079934 RepID=UPI003526A015
MASTTQFAEESVGRAVAVGVRDFVGELSRRNRLLFAVTALNVVLAVVFTVGMVVDPRTLLGRNVWTKPWKFAVSIAIFTGTIGWILPSLSLSDGLERRVSRIVGSAMVIEITLIAGQAARGVESHFNRSTVFDTAIGLVMGLTITVSTLVVAYVLYRFVRDPPSLAPAYRWGLGLGLGVFVAASLEGGVMLAQMGHAVGAPEGGPGLPLLNWSLTGGDLRIAHFVGLHALQVLPLTGYLATRWDRLSTRGALSTVGVVGTLYGALTVGLFVLAIRAVPLVSSVPEVTTATVFGGSFLLVAPVWALVILAPTWHVTERVARSRLVVLPAALLYVVLIASQFETAAATVLSPSVAGVTALFATNLGATAAWVHFLAFDLFVGRWVYLDARRRELSPVVVSPVLCLTLLFGPAGFVAYLTVRAGAAAWR